MQFHLLLVFYSLLNWADAFWCVCILIACTYATEESKFFATFIKFTLHLLASFCRFYLWQTHGIDNTKFALWSDVYFSKVGVKHEYCLMLNYWLIFFGMRGSKWVGSIVKTVMDFEKQCFHWRKTGIIFHIEARQQFILVQGFCLDIFIFVCL